MSRLDELIKELCPNGVEFKKLKDVSNMVRGTSVTKKDIVEGEIPVISGGRMPAFYCDKHNREGETITVAGSGAGAGYVQYWTTPIFVCDAFSVKGKEVVLTKYLYYVLANMQEKIYSTQKGSGVPHVHISSIENFKIPLPPLEIQEEIVKILDKFTDYVTELQAEIQTEIQTRKQQYEYYRDKLLLDIKEDFVKYERLKDVCKEIIVPMRDRPKIFDGDIPWCRIEDKEGQYFHKSLSGLGVSQEVIDEMNLKVFPKGTVICSCSASLGSYAINTQPLITNQTFIGLVCDTEIYNKYLLYFMETQTETLKKLATTGTIPYISRKKFEELVVPIPSLEEQKQIVGILDNFSNLSLKISEGLRGEIDARQKQYEFYRDKLLTFKELEVK